MVDDPKSRTHGSSVRDLTEVFSAKKRRLSGEMEPLDDTPSDPAFKAATELDKALDLFTATSNALDPVDQPSNTALFSGHQSRKTTTNASSSTNDHNVTSTIDDDHVKAPFNYVAEVLQHSRELSNDSKLNTKSEKVQIQCGAALPYVNAMLAKVGEKAKIAEMAFKEAEKSKSEIEGLLATTGTDTPEEELEAKNAALKNAEQARNRAIAQQHALAETRNLLESQAALARNGRFYTESLLNAKIHQIEALYRESLGLEEDQKIPDAHQAEYDAFFGPLKAMKAYCLTPGDKQAFEPGYARKEHTKFQKGKVSISDDGGTPPRVNGVFDYNIEALYAPGSVFFGKSGQSAFDSLQRQVADYVTVAINEYGKGTSENPIEIKYNPPEKPKPELGLAMLMEFKRQAIQRGEPLIVRHNGKEIELTENPNELTDPERQLFQDYATQRPQFQNSDNKIPASVGVIFMQNTGMASEIQRDIRGNAIEPEPNELVNMIHAHIQNPNAGQPKKSKQYAQDLANLMAKSTAPAPVTGLKK